MRFLIRGAVLIANCTASFATAAPNAASICAGSTVLGVVGTANCVAGTVSSEASASDIIAGYGCWNSSGTLVYGTVPKNDPWNVSAAFPGVGYYSSVSNTPAASNLCTGTSVFGVSGSATCGFSNYFTHTMHRNVGTAASLLSATPGSNYRAVPQILKDDDGYTASANPVNKLTRSAGAWSGSGSGARIVCGKGATTVAAKISDCATKNSAAATWNGATNGINGEGNWTLVTVYSSTLSDAATCDATCNEVWRDDRTGLLWSDALGGASTTTNWCRAAGNMETAATTGVDIDTGVAGNQDCGDEDTTNPTYTNFAYSESWCAEVAGLTTPTGITGGVTNSTTFEIDSAKGGMKSATNPALRWRLPGIQDFREANINGIRFVLPNMAAGSFWSASVDSGFRSSAWLFYGYVYTYSRLSTSGVRCVGGE